MRNVSPHSKKNLRPRRLKKIHVEVPLIDLHDLPEEAWVNSEEHLAFSRGGLQHNLMKKLAHGKLAIEKHLDLHGLTVNQALAQTQIFLEQCQHEGVRFALLVHGKSYKNNKPILKNALNIWLRIQPEILAFQTAIPRHGGAGALYLIIKKL